MSSLTSVERRTGNFQLYVTHSSPTPTALKTLTCSKKVALSCAPALLSSFPENRVTEDIKCAESMCYVCTNASVICCSLGGALLWYGVGGLSKFIFGSAAAFAGVACCGCGCSVMMKAVELRRSPSN